MSAPRYYSEPKNTSMPSRRYSEEEQAAWRDREYARYEDGADLENLHDEWWNQLDPMLQQLAVSYLILQLPIDLREEVRRKFARYDAEWLDHMYEDELDADLVPFYSFHHAEGMGVRNLLRKVIADDELPSGNWDDFYVAALLRAR